MIKIYKNFIFKNRNLLLKKAIKLLIKKKFLLIEKQNKNQHSFFLFHCLKNYYYS
jgi:hypothetical protein